MVPPLVPGGVVKVTLHPSATPQRGTVYVKKHATCKNCGQSIQMEHRGGNDEFAAKWVHDATQEENCPL